MNDYQISKLVPAWTRKNQDKVKSLVRYLEDELFVPDFLLIRIKKKHLTADDKVPPPIAQSIIEGWQKGKY